MNKTTRLLKKSNLRLGKETYGTMPIQECFEKAFTPYFNPKESRNLSKKSNSK